MYHGMNEYCKLVSVLGESLGNSFRVFLYDTTQPNFPVVAAANRADSSERKIRTFLAKAMKDQAIREEGFLTNCLLEVDRSALLKLSVSFVCEEAGNIVGALCIAMRCEPFFRLMSFAESFVRADSFGEDSHRKPHEATLDSIEEVAGEYGIEPGRFTQYEREEIICDLYDMGVYQLKGAVAKTAEVLRISEQSVYRYLSKIKKARGQ